MVRVSIMRLQLRKIWVQFRLFREMCWKINFYHRGHLNNNNTNECPLSTRVRMIIIYFVHVICTIPGAAVVQLVIYLHTK